MVYVFYYFACSFKCHNKGICLFIYKKLSVIIVNNSDNFIFEICNKKQVEVGCHLSKLIIIKKISSLFCIMFNEKWVITQIMKKTKQTISFIFLVYRSSYCFIASWKKCFIKRDVLKQNPISWMFSVGNQ